MLRDWKRDIIQGCGSACDILRFMFITSWLDWTIIGIIVSVLILGTSALWTGLTILLIMFVCREAFQMSVSLKRYIFTPENWLEVILIALGKFCFSENSPLLELFHNITLKCKEKNFKINNMYYHFQLGLFCGFLTQLLKLHARQKDILLLFHWLCLGQK